MTSLSLEQMEDSCKRQYITLNGTIEEITIVLSDTDKYHMRNIGDLRELSGKIKVFMNGKLKQLIELIGRLKLIETGVQPQSDPPLFINDVQGYYDLTMIEARNIEQRIKDLMPKAIGGKLQSADNGSATSLNRPC
ncbi:hypothetical protein O3M35_007919 [Rhynocoris fuscipes]|uniref:Uncharacterized protein n=1 Tax=Rhynocoris fuscipes TaxID=488301 RepID=A0AAW1DB11_9HEMI